MVSVCLCGAKLPLLSKSNFQMDHKTGFRHWRDPFAL